MRIDKAGNQGAREHFYVCSGLFRRNDIQDLALRIGDQYLVGKKGFAIK